MPDKTIDIKIPSPGESISEVELANWFVENGDFVTKDQEIGEIESEKATLPLIAEKSGKIELLADPGETLNVGAVAARIDTSVQEDPGAESQENKPGQAGENDKDVVSETKSDASRVPENEAHTKNADAAEQKGKPASSGKQPAENSEDTSAVKVTPLAGKIMQEEGLNIEDILNGLRRITASDVKAVSEFDKSGSESLSQSRVSREEQRATMSQLRKKISERLVAVKNETAMLTTFNEADMSAIMALRKKHQDKFVEKYGIKLGFMSFFTKAVTLALRQFPNVNSYIDGDEVVTPDYCDVGIAVQTDKGLMVPVIRNAETLSLAAIEQQILDLAGRARKNRISMDELTGGTFTITNGGIFGSMLSTPILNPPQSGILGMHNIIERPVAISGKVEIRPMMYLALSYDHRVIDGRDSVSFLKTVKEYIEDPTTMLFGDRDRENILLDL